MSCFIYQLTPTVMESLTIWMTMTIMMAFLIMLTMTRMATVCQIVLKVSFEDGDGVPESLKGKFLRW